MHTVKKIAMLPVWVGAVLSQSKSFVANPVIGNAWLNRAGLHAARLVLAHAIFAFKSALLLPLIPWHEARSYWRNGVLMRPNVLPQAEFEALVAEVRALEGEMRQCIQGDTITQRLFLDDLVLHRFPHCAKFIRDAGVIRALKFCAATNEAPRFYIEKVCNNAADSNRPDPQKTMHSDTFHPTMKAWLFLEDVTEANGPFTYVPGSSRLSWARLRWEYKRSLVAAKVHDGYSEKGSFRIEDDQLAALGLPQPVPYAVAKNTLVIANTYGFHKRGTNTQHGATRLEIWCSSRTNPFNPWPGLGLDVTRRLRDKALIAYEAYLDKKAEKAGRRASWHKVQVKGL